MGDFKFSCPHCKQHLEAPADMTGEIVVCPTCNHRLQLPAHQPRPKAPPPPASEPQKNLSLNKPDNAVKSKVPDLGMIVGIIAGAITLLKHLLTDKPLFLQVFGIGHGGFGGTLQETMLASVLGVATGMLLESLLRRKR